MKVAFLACPETMPSAGEERRGDAFEHDLMIAALRPAFAARSMELIEIEWRAPLEQFEGIRAALLGTAWDYQDHAAEFLAKLEALAASGIMVCNPPDLVRWNMDKRYLKDLADAGVRTIPTLWVGEPDAGDVEKALGQFGTDSVVVKRQVGAGALGQVRFSRDTMPADDWRLGHPAMIQPFLPAIETEGELSLVFIGGEHSHAIRKTPAAGEYRIQSLYGGKEAVYDATPEDIAAGEAVIAGMPGETPLYARIDMLRADDGAPMLMEAEAIEPYLYPEQGPELGERMADRVEVLLGGQHFK